MSIASEISRLQTAKANLKTQIEAKGVTVDTAATLDSYASYVEEIPTGGGDENRLNMLLTDSLTALTSSDLSGVTRISDYLCQGKSRLTTVNAPDIATFGNSSFATCNSLTGVSFSNYQNITIGPYAFDSYNAKNKIKDITINKIIEIGDYAFRNCTNLTSCTFTEIVKSTSRTLKTGAFMNCTGLSSLVLPFNMLDGNEIFKGCTNLTGITFVDNVSYIGQYSWSSSNIFSGCTNLGYLDFTHNIKVPTVGAPANSFNGLPATTEIRVPQSLYDAWTASTQWSAVTSQIVAYPDVYTPIVTTYATNNSSAATPNKAYNNTNYWKATFLADEYDATTGGTITFYGPEEAIPEDAYRNTGGNLTSYAIGSGCTKIGPTAFYMLENLSAVTIPDTVQEIGGYAFYKCGLTSVNVPSGLIRGSMAFAYINPLTSVTLGDGVYQVGNDTFVGCTALTTVEIGEGITAIGNGAFNGCSSLNSITVKASVPPTVYSGTFQNVASTGTLYVPAASITAYQDWIGTYLPSNWTITAITE